MTLVQAKPAAAAALPDDSAALRRRLLQDLERQWLETWGQAHQGQAQLQSASQPGAAETAASALRAEVAVVRLPPPADASQPQRAKPAASRDDDARRGSDAQESAAPQVGEVRERPQFEPSGVADAAAVTAAASAGEAVLTHVTDAGSRRSPIDAHVASLGTPDVSNEMMKAQGAAWIAGRWIDGLPAAVGLVSLQPGSAAASPTPLTALPREANLESLAAMPTGVVPHAEAAEGESAAAVARRAFPPPAAMQEPGSRQLMLRELNEQEVLASMRDAQLTASESAWAAQGLARALMQAGYARVQVIVNGQQHRQESADGDGLSDFKVETPAPLPHPDVTPPSHHGH